MDRQKGDVLHDWAFFLFFAVQSRVCRQRCSFFLFRFPFQEITMRRDYWIVAVAILSLCVAAPASAASINLVNGDFETVSGGAFTGWSMSPSVQSASVISGTYSAECKREGSGSGMDALQDLAFAPDCTFSADFACFPTSSNDNRTFSLHFLYGGGASSATNFRVVGNGVFQIYNGSSYQTISGLTAQTTVDAGGDLAWNGETPVVNHIEIATHYSAATPSYDVTLNGAKVSGITWFQNNSPNASYTTTRVTLAGDACVSNFLADNMSITTVPEPSTLVLSIVGLVGLTAYAWRKRK
jgi:hypothetical protein